MSTPELVKERLDTVKFGVRFSFVDGCIESHTHKATNSKGYVQIRYQGRTQFLHRIICELFHGIPGSNEVVRHSCDNRRCCNPDHLSWGSSADNTRDMMIRGRQNNTAMFGVTNHQSKLLDHQVRDIRESSESGVALADRYKISPSLVSRIRLNKTWQHLTSLEN